MSAATQDAARGYIERGFSPIPVPAGSKNPNRKDWEKERHTLEDVPASWSNGQNIGLLTGEPSGWLVDVDLDVAEAAKIAERFLPSTLTSGRASSPDSHRWYISPDTEYGEWKDTITRQSSSSCAARADRRSWSLPPTPPANSVPGAGGEQR